VVGGDDGGPAIGNRLELAVAVELVAEAIADATPPAMFAPARLWTSRAPVRSRIEATMAAVVVFPLVAETTTEPCSRRPASIRIAWGSRRISTLPGSDVPPPRPARRARPPTALAATSFGASIMGRAPAAPRG